MTNPAIFSGGIGRPTPHPQTYQKYYGISIPATDEVYIPDNFEVQLQELSLLNVWFRPAATTSTHMQVYFSSSHKDTDKYVVMNISGASGASKWYNWSMRPMKSEYPCPDGKLWLTALQDQDGNMAYGSIDLGSKAGTDFLYEIANTGPATRWMSVSMYSQVGFRNEA